MEIKGRITKVLPLRSGTSQRTGNEWKAQPFIVEYYENPSDRYPDRVLLESYDEKAIEQIKEGVECLCGFGHSVREYEGRHYNEVRLFKFELAKDFSAPASEPAQEYDPNDPF